jgi:hypothetical protein
MPKKLRTKRPKTASIASGHFDAGEFLPTAELLKRTKKSLGGKNSTLERDIMGVGRKTEKKKRTAAEKKRKEAYRKRHLKQLKSTPALKHPADKRLIAFWEKIGRTKFKNKEHFYVSAAETLEIPRETVRIRFKILNEAGHIWIKALQTKKGTIAQKNMTNNHPADRPRISVDERERAIIRNSPFATVHIDTLIKEAKKIVREKPKGAKQELVEAMLVYRARTGRTKYEFILAVKG